MTVWRSGILPVHQDFQSVETSAAHSSFVDCTLDTAAAHKILDTGSAIASFVIFGLPSTVNFRVFVRSSTEQVSVNRLLDGSAVVYVSGSPTAGDIFTLQFINTVTGLLTTLSYTVTATDSISTIASALSNLVNASVSSFSVGFLPGQLEVLALTGTSTIFVSGACSYPVGSYVVIDPGQSDQTLARITAVTGDQITLASPTAGTYPAGTPVQDIAVADGLLVAANPGNTTIFVAHASDFTVGDYAILDPGRPDQQELQITGYQSSTSLLLGGSILHTYPIGTIVQQTTVISVFNGTPVDSGPGTPGFPVVTVTGLTTVSGGGTNGTSPNNVGLRPQLNAGLISGLGWEQNQKIFFSWQSGCNQINPLFTEFWKTRENTYSPFDDPAAYGDLSSGSLVPGFPGTHYDLNRAGDVGLDGVSKLGVTSLSPDDHVSYALDMNNPDAMSLWYSSASGAWAMADYIKNAGSCVDNSGEFWNFAWNQTYAFALGVWTVTSNQPLIRTFPLFGSPLGGDSLWTSSKAYQTLAPWSPYGVVASTPWNSSGQLDIINETSKNTSTASPPYAGHVFPVQSFGASSLSIGASRAIASNNTGVGINYLYVASSSGTTPTIYAFDAPVDSPLYTAVISSTSCIVDIIPVGVPNMPLTTSSTIYWPSSLFTTGPTQFTATILPLGFSYVGGAPAGSQFSTLANGQVTIISGASIGTTGVYLSPGSWTATITRNLSSIPVLAVMANGDLHYVHVVSGTSQKVALGGVLVKQASLDLTGQYLSVIPLSVRPFTNDGIGHATSPTAVSVFQLFGANTNQQTITAVLAGTITPSLYSSAGRNTNVYNVICSPTKPFLCMQCTDDLLVCPTGQVDASITQ